MHDRTQYIQFGAGSCGPATWRNFDVDLRLRLRRIPGAAALLARLPTQQVVFPPTIEYGDIVTGLPVASGHCRAIYGSHVLEHLCLEDARTALRNAHRYLAHGGRLRLVVPDLAALVDAYRAHGGAEAAQQFMARSVLGQEQRRGRIKQVLDVVRRWKHLWMWDLPSLGAELERAGFTAVRRAEQGDSEEPRFADVEDPIRFSEPSFDGRGRLACLAVECRKA